jgi:hypothetical protein
LTVRPIAVSIRTPTLERLSCDRMYLQISQPVRPGIITSRTTAAGLSSRMRSRASSPSRASTIV